MQSKGRILAVDPGLKRIGLALSDPQRVLASPLMVISHVQLRIDCARIIEIANEHEVSTIVVGQPLGDTEEVTNGMRHSMKIAEELAANSEIPVVLWDESFSTQDARKQAIRLGKSGKNRKGHLDDHAAAMILQSFLDSHVEGSVEE